MSDFTLLPKRYAAVTPSDTTPVNTDLGLFIGGAGNVVVTGSDGVTVTFIAGTGQYLTGYFKLVKAATTATGIVALY